MNLRFLPAIAILAAIGSAHAFAPGRSDERRPNALNDFSAAEPLASGSAVWRTWIDSEIGSGHRVVWNRHTGLASRIYPQSTELGRDQRVEDWLSEHLDTWAELAPLAVDDLRLVSHEHDARGLEIVHLRQFVRGVPVEDSHVGVAARGRKIVWIALDLIPNAPELTPAQRITSAQAVRIAAHHLGADANEIDTASVERLVVPVLDAGAVTPRLALRVPIVGPRKMRNLRVLVDAADGRVLDAWDANRYIDVPGRITGLVYPEYGIDPGVSAPLPHAKMEIVGQSVAYTDADGFFTAPVDGPGSYTYKTKLRGLWAKADEFLAIDPKRSGDATAGDSLLVDWDGSKAEKDQRNGYYHATQQHDFIKAIDPDFTGTDYQMNVRVGIGFMDNAFWDGFGINFGAGRNLFRNLAEYSDVVLHEYTHGTTDRIYGFLQPSSAMHEGFSDYWACTVNDDPQVGEGMMLNGDPYLRTIENDKVYPDDLVGEGHIDGEIIAGAMWDTRLALGATSADDIFHFARYLKAKKMDVYAIDVLITDDDDGNLLNGTPHGSRIHQAFSHHGLLDAIDLVLAVPEPPAPLSPGDAVSWEVELSNGDAWDHAVDIWVEAGPFLVEVDQDVVVPPGSSTVTVSGTVPANAPVGSISVSTWAGISAPERHVPSATTAFVLSIE
ncbi:MAG: hypothetical protein CME06_06715 [Gemmatimonadetes bacterium]|nr:hypothetical protein [Gemmatimonadota bacterium]